MKVDVYRRIETSESITGEFWVDGAFECYCLEPSRNAPYHAGYPCIQAGTYRVILSTSPHLGYMSPEVIGVPGRSGIRWHIGNFPRDVFGCSVVGSIVGPNYVGNSKLAFQDLMRKLQGKEILAVYHDPDVTTSVKAVHSAQSSVESTKIESHA